MQEDTPMNPLALSGPDDTDDTALTENAAWSDVHVVGGSIITWAEYLDLIARDEYVGPDNDDWLDDFAGPDEEGC